MNCYKLVNWSTQEVVLIFAISWEIDPKTYSHIFYQNIDSKIVECVYNTRYWDIRNIDYDTTTSGAK